MAARSHAADVVARVTDDGARSNVLLDRPAALKPGERDTAHRLVLDTLRWLPFTDRVLAAASRQPLADLDRDLRAALRVGVTELLRGGEPHGVVDSTVEVVRHAGLTRASGYANAVLRAVAGDRPPPPRPEEACPGWLVDRLSAQWSEGDVAAFLAASLQPPPLMVRARPTAPRPEGTPVDGIDGAWVVPSRRAVAGNPVMDAASTAVALAVAAQPGETVLDVAAAPGNKTLALCDAMAGKGMLVAADGNRRRLSIARRRLASSGPGVSWVVADGTRPPFAAGSFDRVLLDAPCTGLGTVRRRPEIKLRLDPGSAVRMAHLQRRLMEASLPLLRPGGLLVYSVCTVFAEETVGVAGAFGGTPPEGLPGRRWESGLLLAPHLTGTDGMFVSLVRR